MSVARIKNDFSSLPDAEKIRLVQELWDEIGDHDAAFSLTPEQQAELDARYQRYRDDPSRAIPLSEVEERYERRQ